MHLTPSERLTLLALKAVEGLNAPEIQLETGIRSAQAMDITLRILGISGLVILTTPGSTRAERRYSLPVVIA
jgi:hypothetical protein